MNVREQDALSIPPVEKVSPEKRRTPPRPGVRVSTSPLEYQLRGINYSMGGGSSYSFHMVSITCTSIVELVLGPVVDAAAAS